MKQNNYKIIGITGGIATGKSTVTKIIQEKGYVVIDADKIARDVVKKNRPAYKEVVEYFGEDILNKDLTIDRKKLGKKIFGDDCLREKLNSIIHPYIFRIIKQEISKHKEKGTIIFLDIPLLIEGMEGFKEHNIHFDEIWLVYVDEKTQLNRLMSRDCIEEKEALNKIKAQIPIESKKKYATRIIDNTGNLIDLKAQLEEILKEINNSMEG